MTTETAQSSDEQFLQEIQIATLAMQLDELPPEAQPKKPTIWQRVRGWFSPAAPEPSE